MKLGGTVTGAWSSPEEWKELLIKSRFAAVTCPVDSAAPRQLARDYFDAAREAGAAIAEVGVWKNVLSTEEKERVAALKYAREQLAFADEMGVPCCVNIAGCRGSRWDGAYPDNYSRDAYDLIVETVRGIIDAVRPRRAFYTLEPMPWMVPDGPDEYLKLIRDVGREQFGAHMDFVNMINSPRRSLLAVPFIDECFGKLAPWIKSTHLKDTVMETPFTAVIRETAPGRGTLDYTRVLPVIAAHLPQDAPVLLEHMGSFKEYAAAYDHVAAAAAQAGIPVR